jgi:peptidoglycan/LPS O-acetylase OafA/YrhL
MRDRIPALDGLRAVACLAVIGVHAKLRVLAGGWLGVDVFFVLSGFLITGVLLAERDRTGRIRLGWFYARRAGRLYPALLVTVLAVTVAMKAGYPGAGGNGDWGPLMAVLYLQDFWKEFGHYGGQLAHTWSLAVEEQFYLLWPLVVIILRGRRLLLAAAGATGAASLAMMLAQWPTLTISAQNAPHLRAWELLSGCALAIALRGRRPAGAVASVGTWAGGALLLLALFVARTPEEVSVGATVLAAGGTMTLLAGAWSGSLVVRLLDLAPLRWIGERSYGIYLYHFPIVMIGSDQLHGRYGIDVAIMVALTLALAALSYRWLEEPIRSWVRNRTSGGHDAEKVLTLDPPSEPAVIRIPTGP